MSFFQSKRDVQSSAGIQAKDKLIVCVDFPDFIIK